MKEDGGSLSLVPSGSAVPPAPITTTANRPTVKRTGSVRSVKEHVKHLEEQYQLQTRKPTTAPDEQQQPPQTRRRRLPRKVRFALPEPSMAVAIANTSGAGDIGLHAEHNHNHLSAAELHVAALAGSGTVTKPSRPSKPSTPASPRPKKIVFPVAYSYLSESWVAQVQTPTLSKASEHMQVRVQVQQTAIEVCGRRRLSERMRWEDDRTSWF